MMKLTLFTSAAALCAGSTFVLAQPVPKDYPNKPIRVVAPAPAGASPALLARLHDETVKALSDPDVLRQFDVQGLEAVGSKPDDFARFVAKESAFMTEVARKIEAPGK